MASLTFNAVPNFPPDCGWGGSRFLQNVGQERKLWTQRGVRGSHFMFTVKEEWGPTKMSSAQRSLAQGTVGCAADGYRVPRAHGSPSSRVCSEQDGRPPEGQGGLQGTGQTPRGSWAPNWLPLFTRPQGSTGFQEKLSCNSTSALQSQQGWPGCQFGAASPAPSPSAHHYLPPRLQTVCSGHLSSVKTNIP